MNLLPKSDQDFNQKEYWDHFFKSRGKKAFEWYGEYHDLCDQLHKYIKPKDNVLVVGCGNSVVGNDLYDVGYRNITSIDISNVAIRQMVQANEKRRPELKFLQMDATKTTFEDATFTAILDKGMLDALMPDSSEEHLENANKYFAEMLRVLAEGGRYVCVSLLQEHILSALVKFFPNHNCMFRVVRCFAAEHKAVEKGGISMPVFVVICTKFATLGQTVIELNVTGTEKMRRMKDEQEIMEQVANVQQVSVICNGVKNTTISDENIVFEMHAPDCDKPRYTVHLIDIEPLSKHIPYAAFVVPQGCENTWLFSTPSGRTALAKMSATNRLAVITMHRHQKYKNLDAIKCELEPTIRHLAPANVRGKIPFLSMGSEVCSRKIRCEGNSESSGDYIVEDVNVTDLRYRRLFYLSAPLVIQTEARLRKSGKTRGGHDKEVVDTTFLTCEYHIFISRAIHMTMQGDAKMAAPNTLIIGLGGGALCTFLRKFLPQLSITAVDIDPDMLKIAVDWFALPANEITVEIAEGMDYLSKNVKKYDSIVFDVDNKDQTIGMSCPPKDFLESEVLITAINSLETNGILIINVVVRDETLYPAIITQLKRHFKCVISYKLEDDLNEVFICYIHHQNEQTVRDLFSAASREINTFFKKYHQKEMIHKDDGRALIIH